MTSEKRLGSGYKIGFHGPDVDKAWGVYRIETENGPVEVAKDWINLELLMERILIQLNLVAQGPVASAGNDSAKAKPDGKVPVDPLSPVDRLRVDFERCGSDGARRRVVEEALEELRAARYAPDRSKRKDTVEWKQAIAHDPRPSRMVAKIRGISHATVLRYRKEKKAA